MGSIFFLFLFSCSDWLSCGLCFFFFPEERGLKSGEGPTLVKAAYCPPHAKKAAAIQAEVHKTLKLKLQLINTNLCTT